LEKLFFGTWLDWLFFLAKGVLGFWRISRASWGIWPTERAPKGGRLKGLRSFKPLTIGFGKKDLGLGLAQTVGLGGFIWKIGFGKVCFGKGRIVLGWEEGLNWLFNWGAPWLALGGRDLALQG